MKTLVTGAGGFIGGHLVGRLLERGDEVIGMDVKPLNRWWQLHEGWDTYEQIPSTCGDDGKYDIEDIVSECDQIFHLAENMGGIGFIETHRVDCLNSVKTSVELLSHLNPDQHTVLFSSSACAYNTMLQHKSHNPRHGLREEDAWPAMPEEGYGLQKLYVEKLLEWHYKENGLHSRTVRFHNSYGPHGSWSDGREKAPAALCRKVALAKMMQTKKIDVWGDGYQLRSFMYIDDNIDGIIRLMDHKDDYIGPVNLGSTEMVSVDGLLGCVEQIAFGEVNALERNYQLDKPKGVAGRNSENTRLKSLIGWEPTTTLIDGISQTYPWIEEQVKEMLRG